MSLLDIAPSFFCKCHRDGLCLTFLWPVCLSVAPEGRNNSYILKRHFCKNLGPEARRGLEPSPGPWFLRPGREKTNEKLIGWWSMNYFLCFDHLQLFNHSSVLPVVYILSAGSVFTIAFPAEDIDQISSAGVLWRSNM